MPIQTEFSRLLRIPQLQVQNSSEVTGRDTSIGGVRA